MIINDGYTCIHPECKRVRLNETDAGLLCPNGHIFSYAAGTKTPVFSADNDMLNEYTLDNAAEVHDNALHWLFSTFKTDEETLRRKLISRLQLSKDDKILVTGAGAGNDLPYLIEALDGSGIIYAQDMAQQMLLTCAERYGKLSESSDVLLSYSVSDAANLPFTDNYFDAAYHFGGINLFQNIQKGIEEMNRVVKSGGRVLVSDEGVAPWLINTEYAKMLIENNQLYSSEVPLTALPESARDVHVSWELGNCFYVIDYEVADTIFDISIDVPHVGSRGGSIRTRYYGKLEGIDPVLRDRINANAEKQGMSRVDYIESLLKYALAEKE